MATATPQDLMEHQVRIDNNSLPEGVAKFPIPSENSKDNNMGLSNKPVIFVAANSDLSNEDFVNEDDPYGGNINNQRVAERRAKEREMLAVASKKPIDNLTNSEAQRQVKAESGDGVGTENSAAPTPEVASALKAQSIAHADKTMQDPSKANPLGPWATANAPAGTKTE